MRLLEWLFGPRKTPPHVQEALDAARTANAATDSAHRAVTSYWKARRLEAAEASAKVIDDYQAAELARLARRHK